MEILRKLRKTGLYSVGKSTLMFPFCSFFLHFQRNQNYCALDFVCQNVSKVSRSERTLCFLRQGIFTYTLFAFRRNKQKKGLWCRLFQLVLIQNKWMLVHKKSLRPQWYLSLWSWFTSKPTMVSSADAWKRWNRGSTSCEVTHILCTKCRWLLHPRTKTYMWLSTFFRTTFFVGRLVNCWVSPNSFL